MKALAIYARVSTSVRRVKNPDGTETTIKSQDPENQLLQLRDEAQRLGFTREQTVEFIDRETGTGKRRREQFEKMLLAAKQGRFELLLVWALDRLSREGALKTLLVLDRLTSDGVRVKSLCENWLDPASPSYELLVPTWAYVARHEAIRLSQRVKAGLARAKAMGTVLGRRPIEVEVDKVLAAYLQHQSVRIVARLLGYSRSIVHRTISQHRQEPQQPLGGKPVGEGPKPSCSPTEAPSMG